MERTTWTRENVRHAVSMFRYGRHPAATVYDSIGDHFFLALAPGWLNLGLWDGDGSDPAEAPIAVYGGWSRGWAAGSRRRGACSTSATAWVRRIP